MRESMKNPKVFTTVVTKNKITGNREKNDYYATNPESVKKLLAVEKFNDWIWEPACGEGHISKTLELYGYSVISTDLVYRGYGEKASLNFLTCHEENLNEDIITNPPYSMALEFIEKALSCIRKNRKVAMLLKLQFLEGKKRRKFFDKYPPCTIYVFSERQECAKNGNFTGKSAVCYAWFIWKKGYNGSTVIKWI